MSDFGGVVMFGGLMGRVNLPLFGLGLILLGLSFFVGNKKIIDSEGNNVTRSGGASGSGKPNRLPKRVTRTGGVVAVIASILASLGFGGGGLGTGTGTGDAAGAVIGAHRLGAGYKGQAQCKGQEDCFLHDFTCSSAKIRKIIVNFAFAEPFLRAHEKHLPYHSAAGVAPCHSVL